MKKLNAVAKLVRRLKFDLRLLELYGFKRRYTTSVSGKIWVNTKLGVVVKTPCIVRKVKSIPDFAIPTKVMKIPKSKITWKYLRKVFIQPLASTRNANLAKIRLIDLDYRGADLRQDNVGWYRGKPVLIDW